MSIDENRDIVDISGLQPDDAPPAPEPADPASGDRPPRPWVGVQFECCSVYQRIYRRHDRDAYEGACPRCGKKVRFKVGTGGSDARLFRAW